MIDITHVPQSPPLGCSFIFYCANHRELWFLHRQHLSRLKTASQKPKKKQMKPKRLLLQHCSLAHI